MKYDFKHDKWWKLKRNKAVFTHIEKLYTLLKDVAQITPVTVFENGVLT